jgi:hypothetical protein
MLCQGFAEEIIGGCKIGMVSERLERALAQRLMDGAHQ